MKIQFGIEKTGFFSLANSPKTRMSKEELLIGGHQAQLVLTMLVVCILVILTCRFDASTKIIGVPFCILTLSLMVKFQPIFKYSKSASFFSSYITLPPFPLSGRFQPRSQSTWKKIHERVCSLLTSHRAHSKVRASGETRSLLVNVGPGIRSPVRAADISEMTIETM